jgi:hypothetical protein
VPFDVAFSLADTERSAWIIAMGQLDGLEYDWASQKWLGK